MKFNKKQVDIRYLHDSLLIDNSILVFSDFHIGYEEHISVKGALPDLQLREIIEKLDGIFSLLRKEEVIISQIIILGDLKHEFGGISDKEWTETLELLDYLDEKVDKKTKKDRIVLTKGNHDNIVGPIARKRDVVLEEYYEKNGIGFMHGNKMHEKCFDNNDILIMGHLHPSITLSDKYKREKFKCFLHGKWDGKGVFVLPSFSPISFGYDLNNFSYIDEENKGFFIVPERTLKDFEVVIYNNKDREEHNFGKLKGLIGRNI